jgi:hypothetical protein
MAAAALDIDVGVELIVDRWSWISGPVYQLDHLSRGRVGSVVGGPPPHAPTLFAWRSAATAVPSSQCAVPAIVDRCIARVDALAKPDSCSFARFVGAIGRSPAGREAHRDQERDRRRRKRQGMGTGMGVGVGVGMAAPAMDDVTRAVGDHTSHLAAPVATIAAASGSPTASVRVRGAQGRGVDAPATAPLQCHRCCKVSQFIVPHGWPRRSRPRAPGRTGRVDCHFSTGSGGR